MAKGNGNTRSGSVPHGSAIERLQNSRNSFIAAGMQRYDNEKNSGNWDYSNMANLSETDRTYLVAYLSNSYRVINDELRSDKKLSDDVRDMVRGIDRAVEKLTPFEGTVYRGITFNTGTYGVSREDRQNYQNALDYYKSNVGKDITEKAFLSTGKVQSRINRKFTESGAPSIRFTIDSKTGRDLSRYNNEEYEVLFKRNTRFRVVSVKGSNVHLKEV